MPDPDALWRDIQKLDDLYEELLWDPDDELQFNIEYLKGKGSSYHKQNTGARTMNEKAERINGWAAMIGIRLQWDPMPLRDRSFPAYGD